MRKKIDRIKYRALYGRRMQIIEPCFSDITYCKKMNRFSQDKGEYSMVIVFDST
jgi:hypothetical protein